MGTESSAKLDRVDALVREMFRSLTAQPLSSRLLSVLDQMEDEPAAKEPLRRSRL